MEKLTLYYDGQCNLCSREIALLRRLSPESSAFADIHAITDFSRLPSKQEMLRILHLQADSGEWFTGLDATVQIWSQTRYGIFFKFLNIPGIRQIAEWGYGRWAEKRYCRLYSVCNT